MAAPGTVAAAVEEALKAARGQGLTVDEICQEIWGRVGARERSTVAVNLHRLDEKGRLEKQPMRYKLKR